MDIKNKKGIGMEWYFLIAAIFLGFGAYFIGYLGQHNTLDNYIGQHQFSILKAANEAEKSTLYIMQSAKYSLQEAIYSLAQNGGASEFGSNKCGKFNGASIWHELKKGESANYIENRCFGKDSLTANLLHFFNKNLNQYVADYPGNIKINNYNYEITGNLEIAGKALSPLKFAILKGKTPTSKKISGADQEEDNALGNYFLFPSFKVKVDYNLEEEYKKATEQLNEAIANCKYRQDIGQCFKEEAARLNLNCEDKNEVASVLYDFTDKLNECIHLEEDGVVCRFKFGRKGSGDVPAKTYDIILTNENEGIKAELKEGSNILATEHIEAGSLFYTGYSDKDNLPKRSELIKITIEYQDANPVVKEAFAVDKSAKIELSRIFLLYKAYGTVKFVELAEENNFRAPSPANKIIDLPMADGFSFCAKTGTQVNTYKGSGGTVEPREIVYRFSITYPKQPYFLG